MRSDRLDLERGDGMSRGGMAERDFKPRGVCLRSANRRERGDASREAKAVCVIGAR